MRSRLLSVFIISIALATLLIGASISASASGQANPAFTGNVQGEINGPTVGGAAYPVPGALVVAWRVAKPGVPLAWGVWEKETLPPGIAKRFAGINPFSWTTTDQNGRYSLTDLPGGNYVLLARAPWYAAARASVQVLPGQTVTRNVYLPGVHGAVGGVVYDVYNNSPLDRATLVLFNGSAGSAPLFKGNKLKWKDMDIDTAKDLGEEVQSRLEANGATVCSTDKTGCYYLSSPAGTYRLLVHRPGYKSALLTVTITGKILTRQDVGLEKTTPQQATPKKAQGQKNSKSTGKPK